MDWRKKIDLIFSDHDIDHVDLVLVKLTYTCNIIKQIHVCSINKLLNKTVL